MPPQKLCLEPLLFTIIWHHVYTLSPTYIKGGLGGPDPILGLKQQREYKPNAHLLKSLESPPIQITIRKITVLGTQKLRIWT